MSPVLLENSGEMKNTVIYFIITHVCVLLQSIISSKKKKSVLKQLLKNKLEGASVRDYHETCRMLKS